MVKNKAGYDNSIFLAADGKLSKWYFCWLVEHVVVEVDTVQDAVVAYNNCQQLVTKSVMCAACISISA